MTIIHRRFFVKKVILAYIYIGGLLLLLLREKRTLWILIKRAYTICLNDNLLQEKLRHIETCFTEIKGYPR